MDEELALPSVLAGISNAEKRELYRFKHTHNEVMTRDFHSPLFATSHNIHHASFITLHRETGRRRCCADRTCWPERSTWSVSRA